MYPNYDPAATIPAPQNGAQAQPQPPKSNVGWAVAAVIFFWPIAFSAFTHAMNVYPLWASGDHAGAQYASERARRLGKTSLIVWAVLCALVVVFYAVVIGWAVSNATDIPTSYSTVPPTTFGR